MSPVSVDRGNGSTIIGENRKLQWWMEHAKQGLVRTIPIHANNVSHQNRAFLNGYSFDLGTGFVDSGLALRHRVPLENCISCY